MAIAPLNEFKSKSFNLTTSRQLILEVPVSVAAIILDARAVNITGIEPNPVPLNGYLIVTLEKLEEEMETILVPEMEIPPHDSLEFISGKFVMEEGDRLYAEADGDNKLQLLISYLETSA
jgi:hypothetical protein